MAAIISNPTAKFAATVATVATLEYLNYPLVSFAILNTVLIGQGAWIAWSGAREAIHGGHWDRFKGGVKALAGAGVAAMPIANTLIAYRSIDPAPTPLQRQQLKECKNSLQKQLFYENNICLNSGEFGNIAKMETIETYLGETEQVMAVCTPQGSNSTLPVNLEGVAAKVQMLESHCYKILEIKAPN